MTEYKIEYYEKYKKRPYQVAYMTLPDGAKPSFTNSKECFNFRLAFAPKVEVRYASNNKLVATKYIDRNGNGRLRWKRD